ncbi:hypothetical protein PGN10_16140 (plasmid) [Lactiplantibacillus pentosus]|nr:hypothetical protein [Lactiplantibacillus pentosus]WFC04966.1 hypothetical protein PGN10_16140 [Lactiplantibacillus pentosus]
MFVLVFVVFDVGNGFFFYPWQMSFDVLRHPSLQKP